jgi:hypothetical protein
MKKSLYVLGFVFLAVMLFSACKKNYTCNCIHQDPNTDEKIATVMHYDEMIKTDAQYKCDRYKISLPDLEANCELK